MATLWAGTTQHSQLSKVLGERWNLWSAFYYSSYHFQPRSLITVNNLKICLNSLISCEICFCNVLVFVIFFFRVVYCSAMPVTKATICSVMYLQCLQHRLVRISLLITLRGLKVKGAESQQSSSFCQYSGTLIYRANLYITKSSI